MAASRNRITVLYQNEDFIFKMKLDVAKIKFKKILTI